MSDAMEWYDAARHPRCPVCGTYNFPHGPDFKLRFHHHGRGKPVTYTSHVVIVCENGHIVDCRTGKELGTDGDEDEDEA